MTEPAAHTPRLSLTGFVEYLTSQKTTIVEQWTANVRRDSQIETADRLAHHQLVDHVPRLLEELREFLRARDAGILTGEGRRDASRHGEMRCHDGYRIDELLRELEALRLLVTASAFRYRDANPDFKGVLEMSANALVQQFFTEITVASVSQFVHAQERLAECWRRELALIQRELGVAKAKLEQALGERQQAFAVVAHELRNVLHTVAQSRGGPAGLHDLQVFVRQLLEYAEISGQKGDEYREAFDPRELFSALVAAYRPLIDAKGLRLFTDCASAPGTVIGDSRKIRRIVEILLNNAVRTTRSGHIACAFSFPDEARWVISVSDTGTGLSNEASQRLFGAAAATAETLPHYGIGFAIAKALVLLLGGTLNTETRSGMGTRFVVVLPRAP